jgi:hypothetical protein
MSSGRIRPGLDVHAVGLASRVQRRDVVSGRVVPVALADKGEHVALVGQRDRGRLSELEQVRRRPRGAFGRQPTAEIRQRGARRVERGLHRVRLGAQHPFRHPQQPDRSDA